MKQVALFEEARKGLAPEAKRLLAKFDVVAEAPGGVKRLRELILNLAVSGKLAGEECSHSDGTTVDSYVSFLNGYAFKSEWFVPEGVSVLRNVNVSHGSVRWEDVAQVSVARANEFERFALAEGDIVISLDRPIIATGVKVARVAQKDLPCLLLQRVAKVEVRDEQVLLPSFLFTWFRSSYFTGAIDPGRSKGVPHISTKQVGQISFKPPSIAGQHRTMRVLSSLMVFCDDLEARQTKQRETAGRLTKSALHALTSAEGPEELAASWRRVAGSFDALLNSPESVADLRASVLELAVRGRLVPLELGARPVPVGAEGSIGPFELPSGWKWATPDDLKSNEKNALAIGPFGSNLLKADYTSSGVPLVFVRDITSRQFGGPRTKYVSAGKAKELSSHFVHPGDLLITKMGSPPGDTAIYPLRSAPAIITADCIRFASDSTLTSSYFLQIAIESTSIRSQIVDITMGVAHQKVSLRRFRTVLLPMPPLSEQKRIVAKVDELMKLCDALENALRRAEDTAKNLADALVAELLA